MSTYIFEGVPPNVATKLAIDTLIEGARNPQTKLLLKAGNFTDLQEVARRMVQEDLKGNEVAQILQLSTNNYNKNKNKFNGNNFNKNFN